MFFLRLKMLKYLLAAFYVSCSVVLTFCCSPAWIHTECDCIHQHLPGSRVVWLSVFNLLKCTLAFFHDIENLKLALSLHHIWGSDFHWHVHTHISLSCWCHDFKVNELFYSVAKTLNNKKKTTHKYCNTEMYTKLDHIFVTVGAFKLKENYIFICSGFK